MISLADVEEEATDSDHCTAHSSDCSKGVRCDALSEVTKSDVTAT